MSIKIITLYLSLFFVLYGCSPTKHYENLPESSIYQNKNKNKKSYSTIKGTLSILLADAYNQKIVRKLFKLGTSKIIFSDNKSKKLFIFDYFKSDQKALNDFFKRVQLTGFYDEKNNIEPVFKIILQGIIPKPIKWGLNSGWQKIQKQTKDPYQPYGFILKKVISVELTKKRIPSDCYLKGVPCM